MLNSLFTGYIENSTRVVTTALHICGRCDGAGYIPHYRHIESGICFKCRGSGKSSRKSFRPTLVKPNAALRKNEFAKSWYIASIVHREKKCHIFSFTASSDSEAKALLNRKVDYFKASYKSQEIDFSTLEIHKGNKSEKIAPLIKRLGLKTFR